MKQPRHDDERLAALLEGRLEGPERDELLAYLATADEDFQVFARTAAVLREMEEEEEAAEARPADEPGELHPPVRGVVPPSARSGWRRSRSLRVIAPAVLAGLLVLGIFSSTRRAALWDPGVLVASLERAEQGLPAGWTDERPWTGSRGEAEMRAARAGALLVDLGVAIEEGDTTEIATLAAHLREFGLSGPSSPIVQIQTRPAAPASDLRPLLEAATDRLKKRLGPDYLQLGAWTEAALLAAHHQDAAFFGTESTDEALARAEAITRENAAARLAVREIRSRLQAGGAMDWAALTAQLNGLMRAIAS